MLICRADRCCLWLLLFYRLLDVMSSLLVLAALVLSLKIASFERPLFVTLIRRCLSARAVELRTRAALVPACWVERADRHCYSPPTTANVLEIDTRLMNLIVRPLGRRRLSA